MPEQFERKGRMFFGQTGTERPSVKVRADNNYYTTAPASLPGAPSKEEKCTGPFSDAFDCPVHNPLKKL